MIKKLRYNHVTGHVDNLQLDICTAQPFMINGLQTQMTLSWPWKYFFQKTLYSCIILENRPINTYKIKAEPTRVVENLNLVVCQCLFLNRSPHPTLFLS